VEVRLDKRFPLEAGIEAAWAVLADVRAVGGCMPGAQITEQLDERRYKGTVRTRIGPASMQFAGEIEVLSRDDAARSLSMTGKGADRAGSAASMTLAARVEPGDASGTSVLVGEATVQVSGKLAQFGSRLLVPVADAMLEQFAANFRAAAVQAGVAAPSSAAAPPAGAGGATAEAAASRVANPAAPAAASAQADLAIATDRPVTAPSAPAPAAVPHRELNILSLLWTVIRGWFRRSR